MKKTTALLTVLFTLTVSGLWSQSAFQTNELLIKFVPGATFTDINGIKSELNASEMNYSTISGVRRWRIPSFPITLQNGDAFVQVDNVLQLLDHVTGKAKVDDAGLNYWISPTPTSYTDILNIFNLTEYDPIPNCEAYPAEIICEQEPSSSITAAILDTGIDDLSHASFFGGSIEDKYDFINDTPSADDDHGHGTKVAGIINGMAMASNIEVGLYILKIFDASGSGTLFDAIEAVDYCVLRGVNLINISWGYVPAVNDTISPLFEAVLTNAANNGVMTIAAAGNSNWNTDVQTYYPASFTSVPYLVKVASTNCAGALSSFSNYGANTIDLAAPGEEVLCPTLGGHWTTSNGTSFATPIVLGICAQFASNLLSFNPAVVHYSLVNSVYSTLGLQNTTVYGGIAQGPCGSGISDLTFSIPDNPNPTITSTNADLQLYPNPFDAEVNLDWTSNTQGEARLTVYNLAGKLQYNTTLLCEEGQNHYTFTGGTPLSLPGIYVLKLEGPDFTSVKMITRK